MVKRGNKASNNTGLGPARSCCGGHHQNMPGGHDQAFGGVTRREFLQVAGTSALGAVVLPGLSWSALASVQPEEQFEIRRSPLVAQPVLTHEVPERRDQTSWRNWGGLQTEEDAEREVVRIRGELDALKSAADFPVDFLPVEKVRAVADLDDVGGLQRADLIVVYAAGGGSGIFDALHETGKDIIFFCRHKSGPVYLWYEIISPRYLRRHTDEHSIPTIGFDDVVIDSHDDFALEAEIVEKNSGRVVSRFETTSFIDPAALSMYVRTGGGANTKIDFDDLEIESSDYLVPAGSRD